MAALSSKLPLPSANFTNNSNTICKPWQLPTLFKSSTEIVSDRETRHVAVEPKNPHDTFSLTHELDKIHADVKATHYNVGQNNATVISFFDIADAKQCFVALRINLAQYFNVYFAKPSAVSSKDSEKLFVVISSNNRNLFNFNYMTHILRIGSIHSISEARISNTCLVINLEYHDERHAQILKANLNCAFIEGAQIMVYNATSYDNLPCGTNHSNKVVDTSASLCAATLTSSNPRMMVATPLPSPVAETKSFFSEPNPIETKSRVPSPPPSPIAAKPNLPVPAGRAETSPSSSDTTLETCVVKKECESYASVAQSTPPTVPTTPSPSHSRNTKKSNHATNSRHACQKKTPKKVSDNPVDFNKVKAGLDKRTTFMIRNIPNKYTQKMFIDYVNETHKNKYDFVYLRIDFANKCNVGYAFINFMNSKKLFKSDKICEISYANIQGKRALMEKFQNSDVMAEEAAYRPMLFYSNGPRQGQEQPWPAKTN